MNIARNLLQSSSMTPIERSMGRFMRAPDHPGGGGEEDTVEIDMDAAVAEISEGLFGQDDSDDPEKSTVETQEAPEPPTSVETPGSQKQEEPPKVEEKPTTETSTEVQAVGAPKTWTKEALEDWAKIPPRAQQEILKREEDMFRGLEQYKEKAELGSQYDKVVEPYRPALAAEGVNPVELFQAFAGNHYLLARGTPEQKIGIAANLIRHYGIDIEAVKGVVGDATKPVDPTIKALQDELAAVKGRLSTQDQQTLEQKKSEFTQQVEAFATDPKNIYFQEVADDIADLLKTGAARDLQQAYDLAVYRNPTTRQKEVDRLAAEKASSTQSEEQKRVQDAEKAKAANLKTSTKSRDGTEPVGSMDETLKETFEKIKARG